MAVGIGLELFQVSGSGGPNGSVGNLWTEEGDNMQFESGDLLAIDTSDDPAEATPTDTDYIVIVQGGITKKLTISALRESIP